MELRLNRITDLPTLPTVVYKIMDLINNPNSSIQDLAKVVGADQVIASKVIRLVNSPLYGIRHEITNLNQALSYLGFEKVKSLVLTCSLIAHLPSKGVVFNMKTFWEHSFGCGIVSRIVATRIGYEDPEGAYLAGLVHDLGEIVIFSCFKMEFPEILRRVRDGSSFRDAETEVLGYSHGEIGAWLGERWRFPAELQEVMKYHHTPGLARTAPITVAIVNIADLFCRVRSLGYGFFEKLDVDFAEEPAWKILAKHQPALAGMDLERFTYELDEKMDEVLTLIGSIYDQKSA